MIKPIALVFILSFIISSCCSLNNLYNIQPTNCQCKRFNGFVKNNLEKTNTNDRYFNTKNITNDSLINVILKNKDCWIGKSFDFVKQQFPPPINKLSGKGFYFATKEDVTCKTDCNILRFQFNEKSKEDKITVIEATLTGSPNEEYKIIFVSAKINP